MELIWILVITFQIQSLSRLTISSLSKWLIFSKCLFSSLTSTPQYFWHLPTILFLLPPGEWEWPSRWSAGEGLVCRECWRGPPGPVTSNCARHAPHAVVAVAESAKWRHECRSPAAVAVRPDTTRAHLSLPAPAPPTTAGSTPRTPLYTVVHVTCSNLMYYHTHAVPSH